MAEINLARQFEIMGAAVRLQQLDAERARIVDEYPEAAAFQLEVNQRGRRKPGKKRLSASAKNGISEQLQAAWNARPAKKGKAKKGKKGISAETRRRMSESAKKRWKRDGPPEHFGRDTHSPKAKGERARKRVTKSSRYSPEGLKKVQAARRERANRERAAKGLPPLTGG